MGKPEIKKSERRMVGEMKNITIKLKTILTLFIFSKFSFHLFNSFSLSLSPIFSLSVFHLTQDKMDYQTKVSTMEFATSCILYMWFQF